MRTGTFVRGAICAAGLCLCHATQAAESGFYAGLSLGKSDYEVGATERVQTPGAPTVTFPERETFENDGIGWAATLGYRMHTYVAVELGYTSFASVEKESVFRFPIPHGFFSRVDTFQYGVAGPTLSLLGILPIRGGWETYLRAGVLFAELENDSLSRRLSSSEEWLAGAGIQWAVADALALRLEYQRIDTIDGSIDLGDVDVDQLSLGLTLTF